MYAYIVYCLHIFFIVLNIFVFLYLIRYLLPFGAGFRLRVDLLVAPMMIPMQKLVQHSIMNCYRIDISPYVLWLILAFLDRICLYLLEVA